MRHPVVDTNNRAIIIYIKIYHCQCWHVQGKTLSNTKKKTKKTQFYSIYMYVNTIYYIYINSSQFVLIYFICFNSTCFCLEEYLPTLRKSLFAR